MDIFIPKYKVNAEFVGNENVHGIEVGQKFEADISIDFDSGYVYLSFQTMKFDYPNFKNLESDWKIERIFKP